MDRHLRRVARLALALAVLLGCGAASRSIPRRPGPMSGDTLLPNGWTIAPAGRHLSIGDLPLAMAESPDGRFLVVTNNGYAKPSLTVVDLERFSVSSRLPLENAWLGLAWHPDGQRLYCSGAADNSVSELSWRDGVLESSRTIAIEAPRPPTFVGGIAVSPDGRRLFAVNPLGQSVAAVDLESGAVLKTASLEAEPYTCLVSRDGKTLYVSLWGGSEVLFFDAATLERQGESATGEHPNAMVESPDGTRLYVACANTNAVWVLDRASRRATEQIGVSLFPGAPEGSTPNSVALSRSGRRLLVANADNNAVAVVDVATPGHSRVEGFLPTGWYPTAAAFDRDDARILVLSGKGLTSHSNPGGPQPGVPAPGRTVRDLLTGALSVVPTPDDEALAAYTRTVYRISRYTKDAPVAASGRRPRGSPIPSRVGAVSPIRHVFYVIRENRTYDQILGDVPTGDGDANLCLFGEETTPNAHALAREFVLFDNFYVDAEVSYDGHAFSTAAYATDVVEKFWPQLYGNRGGKFLSTGGGPNRNAYGNVTAPAAGYIWDLCRRSGVSVRSYGEFAVSRQVEPDGDDAGAPPYRASVPGLRGAIAPNYPPWDLAIPDGRRVDAWLKELREYERNGRLPRLSIIRLPNDHTAGTRPGSLTPRAMIAENDRALGRLVEAISKSRYWKESAIFVLEDDAQDGPDHVDAHRSVALVASPWARRGAVDSTLYTTCAMLRTIELILGLPPMSQYDAAAAPMFGAFRSAPDTRPFTARPASIALDERNAPGAYGAQASLEMDFDEADRTSEAELNEILWRSVKGPHSPMPPPRRAAFVRALERDDD